MAVYFQELAALIWRLHGWVGRINFIVNGMSLDKKF